jgi:SAM-dependent methyltransferase
MLEAAQKEANARGLSNISYVEGDTQALPFADQSFDVVTCRHAPHHFPRVRQAVSEWARVLKPGGRLLLIDSISPEDDEAEAMLHEIESLRDPSHVRNYRISQWRAYLSEAGLRVSTVREESVFLDIPSWTQRMRTPPESVAAIERLIREASLNVRERLRFEEQDGLLSFTLPIALLLAVKN